MGRWHLSHGAKSDVTSRQDASPHVSTCLFLSPLPQPPTLRHSKQTPQHPTLYPLPSTLIPASLSLSTRALSLLRGLYRRAQRGGLQRRATPTQPAGLNVHRFTRAGGQKSNLSGQTQAGPSGTARQDPCLWPSPGSTIHLVSTGHCVAHTPRQYCLPRTSYARQYCLPRRPIRLVNTAHRKARA
eukprot:2773887-Rhodomonas_salina.1